jgi:hypothetical protein
MTENEAKEKYNLLTKEVESLHLQAARKEQWRGPFSRGVLTDIRPTVVF